jgi:hypothetical protein
MQYDFSKVLTNAQKEPMKVSDAADAKPWTAKLALQQAILVDNEKNQGSKLERYSLWLKLDEHVDPPAAYAAGEPDPATDYSTEEVAALKTAALTFPTIFAGQLSRLLDQKK